MATSTFLSQIKQLEDEIKQLKLELKAKNHLISSSEQDYDLKSHIIDKQNAIIELLIKQSSEK
jgi:hypothetical protein